MIINYATLSECGKRSNNEDSFRISFHPEENRWMGIVCDGLGGHPMGEVASAVVADAITEYYEMHRKESDKPQMLKEACQTAMAQLDNKTDKLNHVEMGTTMVIAMIDGQHVTIGHLGDSRCYLIRQDGNIIYQTHDHTRQSFGWEILYKCFFSYSKEVDVPEMAQFEVEKGDRILLCSDGLYKCIPPEILKERVTDEKSSTDILDVLAFLCEKNGDDNYTAILATIK